MQKVEKQKAEELIEQIGTDFAIDAVTIQESYMRWASQESLGYRFDEDNVIGFQYEDLVTFGLQAFAGGVTTDELIAYCVLLTEPGGDIADGWCEYYLYFPALTLLLEIDSNVWLDERKIAISDQNMAQTRMKNRQQRTADQNIS